MLGWLFRRRKAAVAPQMPVLVLPDPPLPPPREDPNGVEGIDWSRVDFDAYSDIADTSRFLDWHYTRFPDARGLEWRQVYSRYQVFCVEHRVRPLSVQQIRVQMGAAQVVRRRIHRGSKRVTVYDIIGRGMHLVRAAA